MKRTALPILIIAFALPMYAQHNVSLTWSASSDAQGNPSLGYNVYRSSSCTGTFSKLNSTPVSPTEYVDSSVRPGSYCYQVTSIVSGTESGPSNQAAVVVGSASLLQQKGCPRRGNLVSWLRCVRTASEAQPKKKMATR